MGPVWAFLVQDGDGVQFHDVQVPGAGGSEFRGVSGLGWIA